ncbi:MAG: hypothetical protein JRF30_08075 [Deltaproteobacteria bacterium]|nr:hypothetical protein [Deltaproteobacteria bacterium]MBW1796313.1 hypothetical protein [Deltaproteobacteria bacterium]MBW2330871.1 hypothetical protein [Deltaproteobacteria bacterium]
MKAIGLWMRRTAEGGFCFKGVAIFEDNLKYPAIKKTLITDILYGGKPPYQDGYWGRS